MKVEGGELRNSSQIIRDLLSNREALRKEIKSLRLDHPDEVRLFDEYLYEPSEALKAEIEVYTSWLKTPKNKRDPQYYLAGGQILERIAYLVFRSLNKDDDYRNVKLESFTSFDAQFDLVVSGIPTSDWDFFNQQIGLGEAEYTRKIIIEAKNRNSIIDAQIFSRLCHIVENQFQKQCRIGIFFAQNNASGFPTKGHARTSLQAARATQIMFHVKTGKYILVFDSDDIQSLVYPGSLIILLREKISDVENVVGEHYVRFPREKFKMSSKLPKHLNELEDGLQT